MPPVEQLDHLRAVDPLGAWWITAVLLAVLLVMAITNVSSPRKWRLLAQAMFRMRLGRQTLREEIDLQDRTFVGLLCIAVCVLALFCWQVFMLAEPATAPAYPWWMGGVALLVVVQGLFVRMLGSLLQVDNGLGEHLYTGLLLFILAGVVMLPLVTFIAYRPEWRTGTMIAGAVVLGLLLLYRWVRGAWIGWSEGVPIRYIILYLCAAEVLPVLLLISALRPPIPPHQNL